MERINKQYIQRIGNDSVYGQGADGNAYIDSTVVLSGDAYYKNLDVMENGVLITNGYRLFVSGLLTNHGVIGMPDSYSSPIYSGTVGGRSSSGQSRTLSLDPGSSNPINQSLLKDIQTSIRGYFIDDSSEVRVIYGGDGGSPGIPGTDGEDGTSVAGNPGSEGSPGLWAPDSNVAGVPGGRGLAGNPGTPGIPGPRGLGGDAGSGGLGGGTVVVVAKSIAGDGVFVNVGLPGQSGSPGNPGGAGIAGEDGTDGTPAPTKTHSNPDTINYNPVHGNGYNPHNNAPTTPHNHHHHGYNPHNNAPTTPHNHHGNGHNHYHHHGAHVLLSPTHMRTYGGTPGRPANEPNAAHYPANAHSTNRWGHYANAVHAHWNRNWPPTGHVQHFVIQRANPTNAPTTPHNHHHHGHNHYHHHSTPHNHHGNGHNHYHHHSTPHNHHHHGGGNVAAQHANPDTAYSGGTGGLKGLKGNANPGTPGNAGTSGASGRQGGIIIVSDSEPDMTTNLGSNVIVVLNT